MRDLPAMEIDQLGLITALFDCICMQIDWGSYYICMIGIPKGLPICPQHS